MNEMESVREKILLRVVIYLRLSNEDKDFFYKLNYSLFFKLSVLDSDRITIVDEYLNDIGGK